MKSILLDLFISTVCFMVLGGVVSHHCISHPESNPLWGGVVALFFYLPAICLGVRLMEKYGWLLK